MKEFIVAFLVGSVAAWLIKPDPEPTYSTVVVTDTLILEREPDTIRTFIDRIRTVESQPVQVAIAPGGAQDHVSAFCRPTTVFSTDTIEAPADTVFLLRSVRYDRKWAWKKDKLFIAGPLSTGDLLSQDHDVRGDYSVRTVVGGTLVQYPRTSLLYDIWEGGSQILAAIFIAQTIANQIR
jgi:hypothetical protein